MTLNLIFGYLTNFEKLSLGQILFSSQIVNVLHVMFFINLFLLVIIIIFLFYTIKFVMDTRQNFDYKYKIITHDLKSPLTSFLDISNSISFLLEKKQFKKIKLISNQIDQMSNSILKMLNPLSIWALNDKEYLKIELFSLNDLFSETIEVYNLVAQSKGINFNVSIDNTAKTATDKDIFKIIFRNLLDNAIKNTPVGGEVKVISTKNVDSIKIINTVNGITRETINSFSDFFDSKQSFINPGFGLVLIKKFSNLLNYKIFMKEIDDKTICFEVFLK